MPIPDRVREVLPHIDPGEPLLPALERELRRATAVTIPPDAWAPDQVPDHLRATFRVLDDQQRPLAIGKDLAALQAQVAPQARAGLAAGRRGPRADRADRRGTFGTLPRTVEVRPRRRTVVTAFPALVDEGETVGVRVVPTEAEASRLHLARCRAGCCPRRRFAGPAGRQGRCRRAPGWRCSSTRTARSPTWSPTASTPPPTS